MKRKRCRTSLLGGYQASFFVFALPLKVFYVMMYFIRASIETYMRASEFFFRQISSLIRQERWEMRQDMPENGRIFGSSEVYLLLSRGRETPFQHDGSGKRS
jgi:hypothetical protein